MNRILLTQGDLVADATFKRMLGTYGLEAEFCPPSGLMLLQRLQQQFYTALVLRCQLLDLSLPALRAQYVLERAERSAMLPHPETQFIAILPSPDNQRRADLLEVGFAEVLVVPVSEYRLASVITERTSQMLLLFHDKQSILRRRYANLLLELGMPPHLKGFSSFVECLVYLASHPDALFQVTKVLYPQVALLKGTSASNLERSMRTALAQMYKHGDREILDRFLRSGGLPSGGKMCISKMLAALTYYYQLRYAA